MATKHPHATVLQKLKAFGLSLHDDGALTISGKALLEAYPSAKPTGYGLGKSGWVSLNFGSDEAVVLDTVMRWTMESYRAPAPKKLLKALEDEQPWVKAGELPDGKRW